jgi:hypothetical protein
VLREKKGVANHKRFLVVMVMLNTTTTSKHPKGSVQFEGFVIDQINMDSVMLKGPN